MKKPSASPQEADMRAQYDFDYATAERGKYFQRLLREGANVAVLDPDIAAKFHSSAAVNEALRTLLKVSESTERLTRSPRRRASPAP
jgi:hypothetical protein